MKANAIVVGQEVELRVALNAGRKGFLIKFIELSLKSGNHFRGLLKGLLKHSGLLPIFIQTGLNLDYFFD